MFFRQKIIEEDMLLDEAIKKRRELIANRKGRKLYTNQDIEAFKKIENFKRLQRKQKIHTKLYIDTDKALDIYQTINAIQQLPPYQAVKKVDITKRKPDIGDRQIRRGLELLFRLKFLECLEKGQRARTYWIPKYNEKRLEITKRQLQIERATRKQAEKEVDRRGRGEAEVEKGKGRSRSQEGRFGKRKNVRCRPQQAYRGPGRITDSGKNHPR